MKWMMDKSKNLTDEDGHEALLCKTKAVNGVARPKLSVLFGSEQEIQSRAGGSCNEGLKALEKVTYSKLKNVTDLNLIGNSLEQLPTELNALQTLLTLNVSCNNLTSISESVFSSLQCLRILNLSGNKLSELPTTIFSLKHLRVLNVSENRLSELPDDVGQLRTLEVLDLSTNGLQTLPPSLEEARALHTLDVSGNGLGQLPECVRGLRNLVRLGLSRNRLARFDGPLACCSRLVRLDLSRNRLAVFPGWLLEDHCMWLQELDLSHNPGMEAGARTSSSFDTGVKYLRKQLLRSLRLRGCRLAAPALTFLHGLRGLEVLDLGNDAGRGPGSGNAIWALPPGQLGLSTNLRQLAICNVGLTEFPEDLKGAVALEVLDLGGNELSFLPASFCRLRSLRRCVLARNQLDSLPGDIGTLASLEELWLQGNKLRVLPESFAGLRTLVLLDLYDNLLGEVPACLGDLPSLRAVDLELNFVSTDDETIADRIFGNYQELKANLRLKLSKSLMHRVDGAKLKKNDPDCFDDSGNEDFDRISSSDCSETFQDPDPAPATAIIRQDSSEPSCWGDDAEADDNFDPNERVFLALPRITPAQRVNTLMFPKNFCPVDMHFRGIHKGRRQLVTGPVESQFDDCPFDDTDLNPCNIRYLLGDGL
ncbi:leucine-rich repeat protein soc-2 homolog [Bacillus rossius redtenbacheri]|uniref:leucine-rich repeat protein soc-2 homolog n=1 Tax=Bacillus rossius redtenbacheri TaxID=93214 RepID=UPI002FDEA376